jgi:hypothetical protein
MLTFGIITQIGYFIISVYDKNTQNAHDSSLLLEVEKISLPSA